MSLFFEIQEIFGTEVCEWLQENFAGETIRVPQRISTSHPLAALGAQAQSLAVLYGGGFLWIPKGRLLTVQRRDQKLIADFYSGASIDDLSLRYSMSRRNVFKCLKRGRGQCN